MKHLSLIEKIKCRTICRIEESMYFCLRKAGRVVECGGLENR